MAQILVVDDEVGIRELLSEILSDEGHSVQLAANATAARSLRAQRRPDLVLLDIWMPDADGITLLKEWATGGQLTMPVIMMSGHGTIDTAVEATRIGAMDFLEKPIALQKLLATVKRALRAGESRAVMPLSIANFGRSMIITELKKRLARICGSRFPAACCSSGSSRCCPGTSRSTSRFSQRARKKATCSWCPSPRRSRNIWSNRRVSTRP